MSLTMTSELYVELAVNLVRRELYNDLTPHQDERLAELWATWRADPEHREHREARLQFALDAVGKMHGCKIELPME